MRITIDATAALLRSAGVKSYTYHWIRHLRRMAGPDEQIRGFPYLNDLGALDHESSVVSRAGTLARLAVLYGVNTAGSVLLDQVIRGCQVFHASNQVRHAPGRARLTATIHDLTCFLMPELHTPGNVRADRSFAETVLKRAHGLIAVSENSRQDAIRVLGIPPERIVTIHSGVPDAYFDAGAERREQPYVLYVGTIEPRKNLGTLLDAWGQMRLEVRREFELRIAGPAGWDSDAMFARIRREAKYLRYVPEPELPALVAGAAAFVYPSLYEGFGFPVAQAMAAGTPVVTSNTSCLPEIAGDAALLVDPLSSGEIAAALERLLGSPALRCDMSARGRERARLYNWDRCAAQSLEFFRNVAGK